VGFLSDLGRSVHELRYWAEGTNFTDLSEDLKVPHSRLYPTSLSGFQPCFFYREQCALLLPHRRLVIIP